MEEVVWWIANELKKLNIADSDDIAKYIESMESKQDIEDYLSAFCPNNDENYKTFISQLHTLLKENSDNKTYSTINQNNLKLPDPLGEVAKEKQKKKTKFVPLFSSEGQAKVGKVVLLPGRHRCDCQASRHKLINNCINCGRIVCEQEGSGPCAFCGELVCSLKEQEVLVQNSYKSEKLRKKLLSEKDIQGLNTAIKQKEQLLLFDKTCVQRTKVIDDEIDYFSSNFNPWLTEKQKLELLEKENKYHKSKHSSERDKKFTFDLTDHKVYKTVQDKRPEIVNYINLDDKEPPTVDPSTEKYNFTNLSWVIPDKSSENLVHKKNFKLDVIQDKELQEMVDEGKCLSIHQPFASLSVWGIKKHEGRVWYTPHRGKLWIASTSKMPALSLIQETCKFYLEREQINIPNLLEKYPISCLLGCVHLTDCMPQEEYRKHFPIGTCDDPYVWIFDHPQELFVKFPVHGKNKIWKLESHIHSTAKKSLKDRKNVYRLRKSSIHNIEFENLKFEDFLIRNTCFANVTLRKFISKNWKLYLFSVAHQFLSSDIKFIN